MNAFGVWVYSLDTYAAHQTLLAQGWTSLGADFDVSCDQTPGTLPLFEIRQSDDR